MILFNPIWLFALGTLAVPILIHLWNISKGKTLKVGSVSLISHSTSRQSRSFKLHNILLLLLRCLLLAVLALVLAMPFLQKPADVSSKGWLLIPKEHIGESYQKFKPEIDSLIKAGYQVHYFDKGFEKVSLVSALADTANRKNTTEYPAQYWGLIRQLNGLVSATLPVYLFTPNRAAHFTGTRPTIAMHLKWRTYTAADSVNTRIQSAWFNNTNDIEVAVATSEPAETYITTYTVKSGGEKDSPFLVYAESGKLNIKLKAEQNGAATVDTTTRHFAIVAGRNAPDANYLKAALDAVVVFTRRKAVVKVYNEGAPVPTHQNWVFWLSGKPVDRKILETSDHVLSYQSGKVNDVNSWIKTDEHSFAAAGQKITLYKSIAADKSAGDPIWLDGFGSPVLSLTDYGKTSWYHFYSRFDPLWNDLVWSTDFPKVLLKLVAGPDTGDQIDNRAMEARQLQPVMMNDQNKHTIKITRRVNLSYYFWLLLVFIFLTERWLAQKNKILQNG